MDFKHKYEIESGNSIYDGSGQMMPSGTYSDEFVKYLLKQLSIAIVSGTAEHHCGNQITEKELLYDHCLKCGEYFSED